MASLKQMFRRTFWKQDNLEESPGSFNAFSLKEFDIEGNFREVNKPDANLIGSRSAESINIHYPVIDLDNVEVFLVPSRTEGGYHLYINKAFSTGQYDVLLKGMVDSGLVEDGFYKSFQARGFTVVRKEGTFEPHSRTLAEKRKDNADKLEKFILRKRQK